MAALFSFLKNWLIYREEQRTERPLFSDDSGLELLTFERLLCNSCACALSIFVVAKRFIHLKDLGDKSSYVVEEHFVTQVSMFKS